LTHWHRVLYEDESSRRHHIIACPYYLLSRNQLALIVRTMVNIKLPFFD